jgi:hypothetical protein
LIAAERLWRYCILHFQMTAHATTATSKLTRRNGNVNGNVNINVPQRQRAATATCYDGNVLQYRVLAA